MFHRGEYILERIASFYYNYISVKELKSCRILKGIPHVPLTATDIKVKLSISMKAYFDKAKYYTFDVFSSRKAFLSTYKCRDGSHN